MQIFVQIFGKKILAQIFLEKFATKLTQIFYGSYLNCPLHQPLRINLKKKSSFDGFLKKMMMKLKNLWEEAIRGTLRCVGHLGKPATWWGLDVLRLYFHPLYFLHLTLMSWCTIALVLHRNSRSPKNQMKNLSQERSYLPSHPKKAMKWGK